MSCRPASAALQLLAGARNSLVFRAFRLSHPPSPSPSRFAFRAHSHPCINQLRRRLSRSCIRQSTPWWSSKEDLGDIIDLDEKDIEDDFLTEIGAQAEASDQQALDQRGPPLPIIGYLDNHELQLPTQPSLVVKAAEAAEAALDQESNEVDISLMYSTPSTRRERTKSRYFWTRFRRMLWHDEATRLGEPLLTKHRSRAVEFELRMLHQLEQPSSAEHIHPESAPKDHVLSIIIGALAHSAKLTLSVLELLEPTIDLPFRLIADCLRHIRRFHHQELNANQDLLAKFDYRLANLRRRSNWPLFMRPSHMDLLLHNLTRPAAVQILHHLLDYGAGQYPAGRLFLVEAFVRLQDVHSALEILASFPPEELESPHLLLRHTIVNMLRLETLQSNSGSGFFVVLPQLLKLGIKPDEMLHNTAIQNAINFNLMPLARELVDYARDEGLQVNSKTHLYLLRNSFLQQDLPRLNEIMSTIHESRELSQNPYIMVYMMNIIRNVCFYETKATPTESLAHLLIVYDRAYNRSALIKLGIIDDTAALSATDAFPDPPPSLVGFFIWSYVLLQRRDRSVFRLWERWTKLIEQDDPLYVDAAKIDAPYHGFLLYCLRNPRTVPSALGILRFMLKRGLTLPTETTWSICIVAYMKYNVSELYPNRPVAPELSEILRQNNAKIPKEMWEKYVQASFPDHDLTSEEARHFVKEEYDPQKPWPDFAALGLDTSPSL